MDGAVQSEAFAAFARRLDPSAAGPLVVALSGGSDSVALLRLTAAWCHSAGRNLLAVSIDHQLQPASAAWTRQAAAAAAAAGAAFRTLAWDGPKPATGLPAAARAARHRLLALAAHEAGARVILLGHTGDDLAEAALMRARGSTLGRMSEWDPSPVWPQGRGLFHFRPLLGQRRAALRAMLAAEGQDWIEDPANSDPRYARARARADLATGTAAWLDEERPQPGGGHLTAQVDGSFVFQRSALPSVGRLQRMLACAAGRERPARSGQVRELHGRLGAGHDLTASLGGARIEAGREVRILREAGERARGGLAPLALIPGEAAVWDGRFELRVERAGYCVQALQGRARALDRAQQTRLKMFTPAQRRALPFVLHPDGTGHCPVLAEAGDVVCLPLAAGRYRAACGEIAREA